VVFYHKALVYQQNLLNPDFSLEKFALALNYIYFVKGFRARAEPEAIFINNKHSPIIL